MRTRFLSLLSAAGVALMFGATTASAQGARTVCKDGTTSAVSGKGACSSHGGVDSKATAASRAAKKVAKTETKAADKAAKTETKAATKVAKTETKAADKVAKTDAKVAKMVKCTDGTMSKGGRGACSHHGGIAKQ